MWGAAFTWSHGFSSATRRAARLDRALCDDVWRCLFPSAKIKHLSHSYSDHRPLLLRLEGDRMERPGTRPFRFETAWTLHVEFDAWLKKELEFGETSANFFEGAFN